MISAGSIVKLVDSLDKLIAKMRSVDRIKIVIRRGESTQLEYVSITRRKLKIVIKALDSPDPNAIAIELVAYATTPVIRLSGILGEISTGVIIGLVSLLLAIGILPMWVAVVLYTMSSLPLLSKLIKKGVRKTLESRTKNVRELHAMAYGIDARYKRLFDELRGFIKTLLRGVEEVVETPLGSFKCVSVARTESKVIRCSRIEPKPLHG